MRRAGDQNVLLRLKKATGYDNAAGHDAVRHNQETITRPTYYDNAVGHDAV
jgi:hypothetical protein